MRAHEKKKAHRLGCLRKAQEGKGNDPSGAFQPIQSNDRMGQMLLAGCKVGRRRQREKA